MRTKLEVELILKVQQLEIDLERERGHTKSIRDRIEELIKKVSTLNRE